MNHNDEFVEAVNLANLYIEDLDRIYNGGSPENRKARRVEKIERHIQSQGSFDSEKIFSVGCGSAFIEIELAKKFGWKISCADASIKAVSLGLKNVVGALENGELRTGQLEVFHGNLMETSNTFNELYSLVLCFDVIGAFTLRNKKKFLEKLWGLVRPNNGRLLITALSCTDKQISQEYSSGNLIVSERYRVKLFSEKLETYLDLANCLKSSPRNITAIRLDDECVLIDLAR